MIYWCIDLIQHLRSCTRRSGPCCSQQETQWLGTRGIHSPIVQGIMHMRRATIYAISVQYQCTDVQTLLTFFEITCVSSYTAMAQGHALNQELFEDWLSSGKNWMQSACYLNHVRSKTQKKRGTYVMKPKAWLKDRYGADQVDSIIATKEHLQSSRKAGDPTWAMDNPDLPGDKDARFNLWLLLQNSFVDPAPDPNIKISTVSVFNWTKSFPTCGLVANPLLQPAVIISVLRTIDCTVFLMLWSLKMTRKTNGKPGSIQEALSQRTKPKNWGSLSWMSSFIVNRCCCTSAKLVSTWLQDSIQ